MVHCFCRVQLAAIIFHRVLPTGNDSQEDRCWSREIVLRGQQGRRFIVKMRPHWALVGTLMAWSLTAVAVDPWSFERLLTYTLENNPDVQIAKARIAAAQAGIEQANAALWPRVQLQSSYVRSDNPLQVFGSILNQRAYTSDLDFNDVPHSDNFNVKGLVTVPLYSGGRVRAGRAAAHSGSAAAALDRSAVVNALGFEVARGFNTVLKAKQVIQAAESSAQALGRTLEVARKRLQEGTLLKTDVLDLEVRHAQAREDLVRARNGHALALRSIKNLAGVEQGEFQLEEAFPAVPAPQPAILPARPELEAAKEREKAAEEQLRAARGGYRPQVSGFGSVDYDRGWETGGDGASYTVGALLQWDIWDGKLTRARVAEMAANLESAREQTRRLRFAIDLEAEQARLELKSATERLAVTEQTTVQAAESAALTRARFEQGLVLATAVLDAEAAHVVARVRRAEAESDQRVAIAALRKALGLSQTE